MVDIRPVSPYNAFNEQRRSSEGGVYPVGAPISDERLFFSLQKRKSEKKALIFYPAGMGRKKALSYKSGKNIRRENSGSDNRKE